MLSAPVRSSNAIRSVKGAADIDADPQGPRLLVRHARSFVTDGRSAAADRAKNAGSAPAF